MIGVRARGLDWTIASADHRGERRSGIPCPANLGLRPSRTIAANGFILAGVLPLESSTRRAFDAVAADYDARSAAPLFARMRMDVQAIAADAFPRGCRVLEIGCGTGLDSEFLVSRGIDVIATEPSSEMIARARTRLGSRATAIQCALEGVDDALRTHDAAPALFDGIFSDFGALNCVADLGPLARLADRRLAHGGRIVLCFMTGYCLWEMAQVIGGKNATATRRFAPRGAPVMVRVGDVEVATFYHRPRDVMNALGASYRLLRTRGLAVVVPPPYMESVWHRMPRAARRALTVIDDTIAPHWPFNRCGDHIVLDIVKG